MKSAGCTTGPDCVDWCNQKGAEAATAGCAAEYSAMIDCVASAAIKCDNSTGMLLAPACYDAQIAHKKCMKPTPAGCESIPIPVTSLCQVQMNPNDQCTFECTDQTKDQWSSECSGSTCTCKYHGTTLCTCAGSCNKNCCPGAY